MGLIIKNQEIPRGVIAALASLFVLGLSKLLSWHGMCLHTLSSFSELTLILFCFMLMIYRYQLGKWMSLCYLVSKFLIFLYLYQKDPGQYIPIASSYFSVSGIVSLFWIFFYAVLQPFAITLMIFGKLEVSYFTPFTGSWKSLISFHGKFTRNFGLLMLVCIVLGFLWGIRNRYYFLQLFENKSLPDQTMIKKLDLVCGEKEASTIIKSPDFQFAFPKKITMKPSPMEGFKNLRFYLFKAKNAELGIVIPKNVRPVDIMEINRWFSHRLQIEQAVPLSKYHLAYFCEDLIYENFLSLTIQGIPLSKKGAKRMYFELPDSSGFVYFNETLKNYTALIEICPSKHSLPNALSLSISKDSINEDAFVHILCNLLTSFEVNEQNKKSEP